MPYTGNSGGSTGSLTCPLGTAFCHLPPGSRVLAICPYSQARVVLPKSLNFFSGPLGDLWLSINFLWAVEIWGLHWTHLSWQLLLQECAMVHVPTSGCYQPPRDPEVQGTKPFAVASTNWPWLWTLAQEGWLGHLGLPDYVPSFSLLIHTCHLPSVIHLLLFIPAFFFYDLVHRTALDRC